MASDQNRTKLDARTRQGDTVIPSGTGGKTLEAQEHLAEGRSRGGQTRREQLGQKDTRILGDVAGRPEKSSSGEKGIRKWTEKVGSAPLTSLVASVRLRKGFKVTNLSSRIRAPYHPDRMHHCPFPYRAYRSLS